MKYGKIKVIKNKMEIALVFLLNIRRSMTIFISSHAYEVTSGDCSILAPMPILTQNLSGSSDFSMSGPMPIFKSKPK